MTADLIRRIGEYSAVDRAVCDNGEGQVYLRVYESLPEARRCIGAYIDFYNSQRPHQSLDYKTPDEVYFEGGHRPVDMMDKPDGLPTSPQVQQHQSGDKIYLEQAA